jgi:hypothetical protein
MVDGSVLISSVASDAGAWFENYGRIWPKDRNRGLICPKLNYLQTEIQEVVQRMEDLDLPVRIVGLKPRQKGSTTYFAAVDYCHLRRASAHACLIGGQYSQTTEVWEMMKTYQKNDTFDWRNTGEINAKEGRWSNGSRLTPETANDKLAGISTTFQILHCTELARWAKYGVANAGAVLTNILKCVPLLPGTIVILESTAEGNCYDDKTEILTDAGWKFFKDLNGREGILTKNPETSVAYYQKQWSPVISKWKGEMVHFETRTVNLVVSPNHMMWMARQKGKMKLQAAETALGEKTDFIFDRAMKWAVPGLEAITIPSYTHVQGNGIRTHQPIRIPIDIWLRFLGHWLADGHLSFRQRDKKVVLTQTKFPELFRSSAKGIADCLGSPLRDMPHTNGRRFEICNAQLASYLTAFCRPKRIPRELLMGLSSVQCKQLIQSIYEGDGDQYDAETRKIERGTIFCGIDKEFQDDLQELALKAGYATSAFGPDRNRRATFTASTRAMVRYDNPPFVTEDYDGMIYCVKLPKDHLLMVRRKGKAVWCGNTGEFHDRFVAAVDAQDFLSGRVQLIPGQYVRVFAPWFEFDDSAIRLTPEQKREMERTIDSDEEFSGERDLINAYGHEENGVMRLGNSVKDYDVWEQLAWRRFAIREECERDKDIFDRDYPHSWKEAFLKSGDRRFNSTGLSVLRKRLGLRVPMPGILEETKSRRLSFRQTEQRGAKFIIFEKPLAGRRYLMPVDVMTGATQTGGTDPDFHSAFVLRAGYWDTNGKWIRPATAARIVACQWDIDVLEDSVWRLARFYGGTVGCKIAIEMNMDRGLTELLKQRSADMYMREIFNRREFKTTSALGFNTNEKTREMIVEVLAKAIREWDTPGEGIDVFDARAIEQMENFVRKLNGRSEAAEGFHDDDVISIALGLQLIEQATSFFPERFGNSLPPDLRGTPQGQGQPSQFS